MKANTNIRLLLPIVGIISFVVIYFVASLYYPGGSQVDKDSIGFSWINNYWCNLLNNEAINGQYNTAQPIAMTGMLILCFSLSIFWYQFPKRINSYKYLKLIIQITGLISMITAFFLFTSIDHDLLTNLASTFGFIATLGTLIGLFKQNWNKLFAFGFFNIIFIGVNNYVYCNKELIIFLPIVQKITFVSFLTWICFISLRLYEESTK